MSFVSAADIFKLCEIAYKLWECAFSKAKNAEKQYADFGVDIQYLSNNLKQLGQVIQDVTKQARPLSAEDHKWDLKTLPQICGDFRKTLMDCQNFLQDERKFSHGRGGFIYNIQWNLTIEPEVRRLRDRVAFHNIKIAAILKPLELKLLLDIQSDIRVFRADVTSRLAQMQINLTEIHDHITGNGKQATELTRSPPANLVVPEYLRAKFDEAFRVANPELQDETKFPLVKGINAFHHHFESGTCKFQPEDSSIPGVYLVEQTLEPTQYLNLMKSIWVIQKVRKGEEYRAAATDRLWDLYVKELDLKCQREFQRFTRFKAPDRRNLDLLRDEEFRIWLDDDEDPDLPQGTDYLKQILHIEDQLEMQLISTTTTGPPDRQVIKTDIDLKKCRITPHYANPSSAPEALNIVLKGDSLSGRTSAFSFLRLPDLLQFQQAITGYKVVYDETDVKLLTFISGRQTLERGRVQIWNPRPLEYSSPLMQDMGGSRHHRKSFATGSSSTPSLGKSINTLHTSPVESEGCSSVSFQLPGVPILVFYVGPDRMDNKEMSFLALEMDPKTMIKKDRCSCSRKKTSCIHSTIERSGELTARRVEATADDEECNLAILGTYQKAKSPDKVKKLRYVHIEFKTQDEQLKFTDRFNETKEIYHKKTAYYHAEMNRERATHVVKA